MITVKNIVTVTCTHCGYSVDVTNEGYESPGDHAIYQLKEDGWVQTLVNTGEISLEEEACPTCAKKRGYIK